MATKRKSMDIALSSEVDWQTQRDLDTLMECERIEKDPKRMAAVSKLAKAKMMEMATIAAEGKDES